jgi:hypothetical protein
MGSGVVWDDEEAPASAGGVVWDDEAPADDSIFTVDNAKRLANAGIRASLAPLGLVALAAPQFDVEPAEATDSVGAFGRGAQQGASLGFSDEEAGVRGALNATLHGDAPLTKEELVKQYVLARQKERGADSRAQKVDPGAYLGGELAGGIAVPLPGGAARSGLSVGAKLARGAKTGAATGAALGLGMSDADLTKGEFGEAALSTGLGAGLGAAGGVLGEGIGMGVGKVAGAVRGRVQRGVQEAVDAETAAQRALQEKAEASAQGTYRSGVQSASRDLEVLQREAAALPDGSPLKKQIQDYLASPEGLAVREQVASNKLVTAPERISEMQQKLAEYQALVTGREANIAQNTDEALANPVQRHVKPRLATLGHRAIPPLLAGIGGMVGGVEGAGVGTGLGIGMSLIQGRPGVIIKNLMQKPAVRKWFWEKVLSGVGRPDEAQRLIPTLEQAAAKGDQRLAATLYVIGQRSEAGRELLRRIAEVSGEQPEGEVAQR